MIQGLLAGLASLAAPVTARILIALGFSVVTVGGVSVAFGSLRDELQLLIGQTPADIAMLIGLGGGWYAMGAILGAMAFVVSLWTLTAATRIMGVGGS